MRENPSELLLLCSTLLLSVVFASFQGVPCAPCYALTTPISFLVYRILLARLARVSLIDVEESLSVVSVGLADARCKVIV